MHLLRSGAVGSPLTVVVEDIHWADHGPSDSTVPATFQDSVARRLASLDSSHREVLQLASLIDRSVEPVVLERIASSGDGQTL